MTHEKRDEGAGGEEDGRPGKSGTKKVYATPVLFEYGNLARLTQGSPAGSQSDGRFTMSRCTGQCQ